MTARLGCMVMGAAFAIVAIWGIIGGDRVLIFRVNTTHNLVHLLSGTAALLCGFLSERASRTFSLTFGPVYALVVILGFLGWTPIVDLLHPNPADNWLHTMIAAVFLVIGVATMPRHARPPTSRTA